ncbi:MAG TPA: DotU family type IV/VI secretion system protein [Polyangiales bacterium]|jgi:type VI secretion system protein ImpK|nr:DotU family type IV/VI secretion system protein [Polyangiales bacterium]
MERVTEITEAVFNALAQVIVMDSDAVPMPEMIHQQLTIYVEQASRAALKNGFSQQDTDDIRYALVALIDETMLQRGGELREFWLPRVLQLRYFNENVAGEAFFVRLESLRKDSARRDVLRVYFLCLLFGFHGQYRIRGGQVELADIIDRVRDDLVRANVLNSDLPLSPRGPRPPEPVADSRRNLLLVWVSLVAATASILLYIGLKLSLISQVTRLAESIAALAGG